jgi:ketosteroid isomerase-like protein
MLVRPCADLLYLIEQMRSDGKMRSGKLYNNEYIFTFRFKAEGKIVSIKEFLDSHYMIDILAGEKNAA